MAWEAVRFYHSIDQKITKPIGEGMQEGDKEIYFASGYYTNSDSILRHIISSYHDYYACIK